MQPWVQENTINICRIEPQAGRSKRSETMHEMLGQAHLRHAQFPALHDVLAAVLGIGRTIEAWVVQNCKQAPSQQQDIIVVPQYLRIRDNHSSISRDRQSSLPEGVRAGNKQGKTLKEQTKGEVSIRIFIQTARTCQSENGPPMDQGRRRTSLQTAMGSSRRSSTALLATTRGYPTVPGHPRCNLHLGTGRKRNTWGSERI